MPATAPVWAAAPVGSTALWNVVFMAAAFWLIFAAYLTAQTLTTTIDSEREVLAHLSILAVYSTFAGGSLLAPRIIHALGARWCIALGALPYVALVGTFLTAPSYALTLPAFALTGLGAALLWCGQGVYLMDNARAQARATGEPAEDVISRFNGVFFGIFQSTGGAGLLLSAAVLYSIHDAHRAGIVLFSIMTAVGALGAALTCMLRPVPAPTPPAGPTPLTAPHSAAGSVSSAGEETEEEGAAWPPASGSEVLLLRTSSPGHGQRGAGGGGGEEEEEDVGAEHPLASLWQSLCDPRMRLLIPIILYNGMSLGMLGSDFRQLYAVPLASWAGQGARGQALLGATAVTVVMAVFFFANALASVVGGRLVPALGRSGLFMGAAASHVAFFALCLGATALPHALPAAGSVAAWAAVLFLTLLFAVGDSVWETQLPAVLQTPALFATQRERRLTNANMRVWQSLGYALQLGIGAAQLGLWVELAILTLLFLVACMCLAYLHVAVASVDGDATTVRSLSLPPTHKPLLRGDKRGSFALNVG